MSCKQCEAKQQIINRLTKKIMTARIFADKVIHRADKTMSEHQPRGKWSYAKGGKFAAMAIKRQLDG